MKKAGLWIMLVAFVASMSGSAFAANLDAYMAGINSAAERLTVLQNPADFGWEWVIPDTASGNTGGTSYHNLYGVTDVGLLGAGLVAHNNAYYKTANQALQYIQEHCPNPGDLYNNNWAYADTYISMVLTSKLDVNGYLDYISQQWQWTKNNVTKYQNGNLDQLYQSAYDHIAGWDAIYGTGTQAGYALWNSARYGIAATALGDYQWANKLAEVIKNHLNEPNPNTGWFYALGWGQALAFFQILDPVKYAPEIADLVAKLETSQAADGSWESSDIQATAYALLGLSTVNTPSGEKAAEWLLAQQNANGGWSAWTSWEVPEIDSEAMQGLIAYQIGLYLNQASESHVKNSLALKILEQAGLVQSYNLLPYASAGLYTVKDVLLAASLSQRYGLSVQDAAVLVRHYGRGKIQYALIGTQGSYQKFLIRLLGYDFPGTPNGKTLDKERDDLGMVNGVQLKAIYAKDEDIHIAFTLRDPSTKEFVVNSIVTLTVVSVNPEEKPKIISWQMISFDAEVQMYVLVYPTGNLAPGYYDLFIGADDGHMHQFRIQITAP